MLDQHYNTSTNKIMQSRDCFKQVNKRISNVVPKVDANQFVDRRRKGRPTAHSISKFHGEPFRTDLATKSAQSRQKRIKLAPIITIVDYH